jgi:hypothetical protein
MTYIEFLHEVIERGIKGASADPIINKYPKRLEGSIEGFNACRNKTPEQLSALLTEANAKTLNARLDTNDKDEKDIEDYWKQRYYAIQIEWVCNCVSAILMNERKPVIIQPTARGYMNAAEIIGVGPAPGVPVA